MLLVFSFHTWRIKLIFWLPPRSSYTIISAAWHYSLLPNTVSTPQISPPGPSKLADIICDCGQPLIGNYGCSDLVSASTFQLHVVSLTNRLPGRSPPRYIMMLPWTENWWYKLNPDHPYWFLNMRTEYWSSGLSTYHPNWTGIDSSGGKNNSGILRSVSKTLQPVSFQHSSHFSLFIPKNS